METAADAKVELDLRINFNEVVSVQLNDLGKKIYRDYYRKLGTKPPLLREDTDGWHVFPLWELMHIFGSELYMGPPSPFIGGIIRIRT
jgi:hypothetical protein